MGITRGIMIALIALAALSPLGLIIPARLGAGAAWGEWSREEIRALVGYVPAQLGKLSESWKAPIPDYGPSALTYVGSAVLGMVVVGGVILLIGRLLSGNEKGTTRRLRTRRSAFARAMGSFTRLMILEASASRSAEQRGWLQTMEPRVKMISVLALVLVVTLLRHPAPLALLLACCVVAAISSRLNLRSIAPIWLAAVGFSLVIILPASLNLVTPGKPILSLAGASITEPGLRLALRFLLRVGCCVGLTSLLTFSTRWNEILGSLSALRVPRPWILLLQMTERYLFVLARHAGQTHLARQSRRITGERNGGIAQWMAFRIGDLFGVSRRLGEEVSLAMAARGFNGEVRLPTPPAPGAASVAMGFAAVVIAIGLVVMDRIWS